jgi:hypothetical protein
MTSVRIPYMALTPGCDVTLRLALHAHAQYDVVPDHDWLGMQAQAHHVWVITT